MKQFFTELLKDKNNNFSLREIAIAVFILVVLVSWIGKQFYNHEVPEFMFYSFVSLIGAGCFGYSLEKKTDS